MSDEASNVQAAIGDKGQRLFALLYAISPPRVGSYIALANAIEEAGHLAVVIVPPELTLRPEELTGFETVKIVSLSELEIQGLTQVDVFFSSETVTSAVPPGSATVCIPHSIPDAGLRNDKLVANYAQFIDQNPTIIRTFDYLVAAVRQSADQWSTENYALIQGVYPSSSLGNRRTALDIVPGGYPKLEYSARLLNSTLKPDAIVYSPTSRSSRLGKIERDGAAILGELMAEFNNMNIILRPYPAQDENEYGRRLAAEFESRANFAFDDSTTGIMSQRRSAVIITDSSSSAITFSLSTHRPLVFVDLERRRGTEVPDENPFGYSAGNLKELAVAVRRCLADGGGWASKIDEGARKNIYNARTGASYLASHLGRFARRESHPEWLSVNRQPWDLDGATEAVGDHINRLRAWHARTNNERSAIMLKEIEDFHTRSMHGDQIGNALPGA